MHQTVARPAAATCMLATLLLSACSHAAGSLITSDGIVMRGDVRVEMCPAVGDTVQTVAYSGTALPLSWTHLPISAVRSVTIDGTSYLIVRRSLISGREHEAGFVLARSLVDGTLLTYCETRYQSTMLRSKRYGIIRYIYSDASGMHDVPQEPSTFVRRSAEWFASCPAVVTRIRERSFTRPIADPLPGHITHTDIVTEGDLIEFIGAFQHCGR